MPVQLLATLLWGTVSVQVPAQTPKAYVAVAPARAAESDGIRIQQLRVLVEAAEKALEAEDDDAAQARAEEADVLSADWSLELLKQPEVQALLQRLKELQEQLFETEEPEPGLKAAEEVVTISGDELRAELELVRSAERGATYDYPIDLNDKVLTWVSLFTTTKRGFMENALGRASMYMPMIRQVFAEEGVPSDLAYLAVIESGFRNEAKSRAKAVGMWQFIRSTGRIYGLNGNAWVEERRDPIKATRAAARYLKRLYEITGDWYLAASSYNAGPLTLQRAIQNIGTRNFWDLARSRWLRTETKNYIPELCAAILVGRNPQRYGLHIVPLMPYAYETVTVASMTSLSVLARCANTSAATLKELNPELLRGSTPPGLYLLRVPPGKATDCLRQLARMPAGKRLDFPGYTVRKGDTLAKVAKRFKLSPEDLLTANDITAQQFKPGKQLLVPPPPTMVLEERDLDTRNARTKALGDRPLPSLPVIPPDLDLLADAPTEAGVEAQPVPMVKVPVVAPTLTPTLTSTLTPAVPPVVAPIVAQLPAPQVTLTMPQREVPVTVGAAQVTVAPIPAPGFKLIHAKAGDTLAKLARTHQVPLSELLRLNPDHRKALHPGDEVRLPGSVTSPIKTTPKQTLTHRVQKGETLASIARKYELEPRDLRAWNRLKSDRILAGQKLRLLAP